MMPYGGLPTIRVLRGDYPNLKIIAMSGGGQPRLDIAGRLGANRTLAKPFSAQQLIAAINDVLGPAPG
jgi:CheY-like chemotaxis protein